MKVKASFTISDKTLKAVDRVVGRRGNRSAFVEQALEAALEQHERDLRDARDIAILDAHADEIDAEVRDSMDLLAAVHREEAAPSKESTT